MKTKIVIFTTENYLEFLKRAKALNLITAIDLMAGLNALKDAQFVEIMIPNEATVEISQIVPEPMWYPYGL